MSTMNMPGFTAENSIYETKGCYRMAAAFDSQNASASVQPAFPRQYCRAFLHAAFDAADRGDAAWSEYFYGAFIGCLGD